MFVVIAAALVMLGLTFRFGLQGGTATAPPAEPPPTTLPPFAGSVGPGQLAVGPEEIERTLRRLVRIGRPVRCGAGNQPLVALTFDDGPGPRTADLLRILAVNSAPATFFFVGDRLGYPGAPTIAAMGPMHAIGNHTWSHASLRRLRPRDRRSEVLRAQRALERAAESPIHLFRPPYGHRDPALDRMVSRLGLVQVLWSSTSGDDRPVTARALMRKLRGELQPGSIVLMHEHEITVSTLPRVLELLRDRGLRPVTVAELLALDPPTRRQLKTGLCPRGTPDAISAEAGGGRP